MLGLRCDSRAAMNSETKAYTNSRESISYPESYRNTNVAGAKGLRSALPGRRPMLRKTDPPKRTTDRASLSGNTPQHSSNF
jgi:hypothetical protein